MKAQYIIHSLPTRKYDFVTPELGDLESPTPETIILEWDGQQHFLENDWFKQTLQEQHEIDILKTQAVMDSGCKMIRIDYTWLSKSIEELGQFILQGIQASEPLVLSNRDMYQWLSQAVISSYVPSKFNIDQ